MRKPCTTAILILLIAVICVGDNHAGTHSATCLVCLHGNVSLPAVATTGEAILVESILAATHSTTDVPRSGSPRFTSLRAPPVLS